MKAKWCNYMYKINIKCIIAFDNFLQKSVTTGLSKKEKYMSADYLKQNKKID